MEDGMTLSGGVPAKDSSSKRSGTTARRVFLCLAGSLHCGCSFDQPRGCVDANTCARGRAKREVWKPNEGMRRSVRVFGTANAKALSKEVKSEAEITGAGELKVNNHTQAALFS